ncbi:hypothetical protein C8R44DRAFT_824252 [Mycena epipterygia]|nr:hypothetical protein C8R44DRAFT_824252 [Mycena epipterygia]
MPSSFPAELVDLVISFLHPIPLKCGNGDDNYLKKPAATAVANCGLVCRAWVPSSRRILFYRIYIVQTTAYGIAKLFKKPERLTFIPFIRELALAAGIVEHRWMSTVFPKIVDQLPSTVHFLHLAIQNHRPPSNLLPRPKFAALTHLEILDIGSPTLAEVIDCVASFPVLEVLKLWVRDGWSDTTLPETPAYAAKTLRSLDLSCWGMGPFLAWIRASDVAISALKLYFPGNPDEEDDETDEFQRAAEYIDSLGASLTSLTLDFDWELDPVSLDREFLKVNTQLRELSLQAAATDALSLLMRIHLPPSLESITMVVDSYAALRDSWSDLDSLIGPLVSVRRLVIVYICDSLDEVLLHQYKEGNSERIVEALPWCIAQGIVVDDVAQDEHFLWPQDRVRVSALEGSSWDLQ